MVFPSPSVFENFAISYKLPQYVLVSCRYYYSQTNWKPNV